MLSGTLCAKRFCSHANSIPAQHGNLGTGNIAERFASSGIKTLEDSCRAVFDLYEDRFWVAKVRNHYRISIIRRRRSLLIKCPISYYLSLWRACSPSSDCPHSGVP